MGNLKRRLRDRGDNSMIDIIEIYDAEEQPSLKLQLNNDGTFKLKTKTTARISKIL